MVAPVNASDLEVLFSPNRKPMFAGKPAAWWHKNGKLMAQQSAFLADTDCRELVGTVLELQRDDYWRKFSDDWGQFCQETFGRPAQWVEQVVEGVRLLHGKGHAGEIPLQMIEQARAQPLGEHRRPTAEEKEDKVDNVNFIKAKGGNAASYLLRRIARDRPELLDQIGPDKPHRSARAAAIEAGIIKPVPTIRLVDDTAKVAAALRKHLSDEQISALVQELAS